MGVDAPLAPETGSPSALRIGVVASQGDFAAHAAMLRAIGAEPVEVRTPAELAHMAALVIPGGESTTISKAIDRDRLAEPIRAHVAAGKPVLGTCAGMIVCDREHLGLADIVARRNAFGRQLQSFEADVIFNQNRIAEAAPILQGIATRSATDGHRALHAQSQAQLGLCAGYAGRWYEAEEALEITT